MNNGALYTLNLSTASTGSFSQILEERGIELFDNMEVQILETVSINQNGIDFEGASKILVNNQIVELEDYEKEQFWSVLSKSSLAQAFTRRKLLQAGRTYTFVALPQQITREQKELYPILNAKYSKIGINTLTILEADKDGHPTSISLNGEYFDNQGKMFWSFAHLGDFGTEQYNKREKEFFELTHLSIVQYNDQKELDKMSIESFDCEPILDISPTVKMCIKAPERDLAIVFAHLVEEVGEYSKATFRQDEVDECATGEAADVINCLIDTLWLNYRSKPEYELVNDKDLMCVVIDELNQQIKSKTSKWAKAVL